MIQFDQYFSNGLKPPTSYFSPSLPLASTFLQALIVKAEDYRSCVQKNGALVLIRVKTGIIKTMSTVIYSYK